MPLARRNVHTIAKNGATALTGDVTLTGGTNVTLTQTGQDVSIAASGVGGSTTFSDAAFRVQDDGDASKQLAFESSGITTATTRTVAAQNYDGTMMLQQVLSRAIPTTVNDYIEIGSIVHALGAHVVRLSVLTSSASFSVAKQYVFTTQYDATGAAWKILQPIADSGQWTATPNDFEVLVRIQTTTTTLRLRRKTGTTAATADIRFEDLGSASGNTFTALTGTGTDATALAFYIDDHPLSIKDSRFTLVDDGDTSKRLAVEASGITTATTRTWTAQDVSGTVYVSGGTDIPVADGGTGASTVATARDNLGEPSEFWHFRIDSDGTDRGTSIVDLFGSTTGITTLATTIYEFELFAIWVRGAGAGTTTFTFTNTQTYTYFNALMFASPAAGMGSTTTSLNTVGIEGVTTAAAALPATASETLSTTHGAIIKGSFKTNSAGTWRPRVTNSASTWVLQAGSYFKVWRLPSGNIGTFVA